MIQGLPQVDADLALPRDARVVVLAARFNADVVDRLLDGCVARLRELGGERVDVHRVPGAFELSGAAAIAARSVPTPEAVVCLGCVIRGDTPHFEYVCEGVVHGLTRLAVERALPVIFGVLTVNTHAQALGRAGGEHSHAGVDAANAAAGMVRLRRLLIPSPGTPGEG